VTIATPMLNPRGEEETWLEAGWPVLERRSAPIMLESPGLYPAAVSRTM